MRSLSRFTLNEPGTTVTLLRATGCTGHYRDLWVGRPLSPPADQPKIHTRAVVRRAGSGTVDAGCRDEATTSPRD